MAFHPFPEAAIKQLKEEIRELRGQKSALEVRVAELEMGLSEIYDSAVPQTMPWTNTISAKATYAIKTLPFQIAGTYRVLKSQAAAAHQEPVEDIWSANE